MFRIETVVHVALVIGAATSFLATAQVKPPPAPGGAVYTYNPQEKCKDLEGEEFYKCLGKVKNVTTGGSSETCRENEPEEKFNQAVGKFDSGCGGAGLDKDDTSDPDKTGSIACSWSKNRCQCLSKGLSQNLKDKYHCNETGRGSDQLSATTQSMGLIDINAAKKRMTMCPHEDPDDTERYEKQLEKAQERVKDSKKKMPELMNKGAEAQDKAAEKQNEVRRKAADLQKEFAKELSEIKKKKSGEEQQAVAEMSQMRGEMDKIDAQIRQYEMSKVDAEVKLSEAKTQIELNCHATASQQVAGRQATKMAAIQKGQPMGDFNKMMNSVGVSSRAAWEKVAEVYYKRCLNSRPTRDSKKSAQNIYESTLRQIDTAVSSARQGRGRIEESLKQVMTTNGCAPPVAQAGVPSGETKLCRSMREANDDMIQAQQNAATQHQQLQVEAMTAQQQLATKNQALAREYADAQQDLNDEQKRIDNLRNYLNLKREKSNGVGGKEASKTLNESYGALITAAQNIITCNKRGEGGVTPEAHKKAVNFLVSIDQIPDVDKPEFKTPRAADASSPPARPSRVPVPSDSRSGEGISERPDGR